MSDKLSFFQQQKPGNQASQLRIHLQSLEDQVSTLKDRDKDTILAFLAEMDSAQDLFNQFSGDDGPNITAEALRFDTLKQKMRKLSPPINRKLGGTSGLKAVRPANASMETHPWWFVDEVVAKMRQLRQKRLVVAFGTVLGVLVIIWILFNTVLKPDPNVVLRSERNQQALELVMTEQDYEGALAQIEPVFEVLPDDPETLLMKGSILEQLGRTDEAQLYLDRAESQLTEPGRFILERGRLMWQFGQIDRAQEFVNQALDIDPEFAEAWFLAGQVHTVQGNTDLAYEALEKAANLALEQDNPTLYTIAKVNLGQLIQSAPMFSEPGQPETSPETSE